ncbi:helix-turn-helix transcriptional regulator [Clostridium cadaveris]|uniref:helix-turn-helix domain-containing protein n=1 Tax=Clostridium cadaveris TaxID=1529 RepID=UPI001E475A96|nr:helix-turn-helix transcriptional regulator [Clostridium cadaveris]UFH65054.1 helix-turn-helix transcriptional regulator [Clostridium cadaveris]
MIRCNLSVLLAERNIKITQISNDTGISRTTLTSISNNYAKGLQFDTLNTLCNYLKITPNQLISYIPVDIEVKYVYVNNESLEITLEITKNLKKTQCQLTGNCFKSFTGNKISSLDIYIELYGEELNDYDEDIIKENSIIVNAFKMLTTPFRSDIENDITGEILSKFDDDNMLDDDLIISFTWSDSLE